jgi:ribosomal protein S18 acetylase RimI-like enzyme
MPAQSAPDDRMLIRAAAYDDPVAVELMTRGHQVLVDLYGVGDADPVDPAEFAPPDGGFFVGYVGVTPVASGAWRTHDATQMGDAEIKRMYVHPDWRRRGFAKTMLAHLETTAFASGRRRAVLHTGLRQPEAINLYMSCGYRKILNFGPDADHPLSACFARDLTG